MTSSRRPSETARNRFVVGLANFEKISAIEGIKLSSETRQMFETFERDGLSADERRKAIMAKHAKKT